MNDFDDYKIGTSQVSKLFLNGVRVWPRMALDLIGTIDPYIAAAMSPDGSTLYVNHDGSEVIAYSFPGLVAGSTVITPDAVAGEIGSVACDSDGVLYWWENTNGDGTNLYASTDPGTPFFATVDEQAPVGLCWSPFDGLLYGFGMVDIVEGQVLSSWDPAVPGGDRQVLVDPPDSPILDWVNGTVPTPNGHIWWVWPHSTLAAWRIRHYDPTTTDVFSTVNVVEDGVVPFRDNRVYWYGDPSGADPAAGYSLDFEHSLDGAPLFDAMSPGQRAAAYVPDFSLVCFERGDTGEVWALS